MTRFGVCVCAHVRVCACEYMYYILMYVYMRIYHQELIHIYIYIYSVHTYIFITLEISNLHTIRCGSNKELQMNKTGYANYAYMFSQIQSHYLASHATDIRSFHSLTTQL